LKLAK